MLFLEIEPSYLYVGSHVVGLSSQARVWLAGINAQHSNGSRYLTLLVDWRGDFPLRLDFCCPDY